MPTYSYRACNLQGKLVKGTMEFSTKAELIEALKKEELLLIDVKEGSPRFRILEYLKRPSLSKTDWIGVKKKGGEGAAGVKPIDLMSFSFQLSNMLGAGITLLQALSTIIQQTTNKKFKRIIENIHHDVEAGSSFSIALEVYPRIFSYLFVNMVRMGELTGKLDKTLGKLTEFIEHDIDLKQKIRTALIYPGILVTLGFVVVMFITTFVMPQFVKIFNEAGVKLAFSTLLVYGFGQAVKRFWYLFLFGSILVVTGIKYYLKTKAASLAFDHLILKIPVIGPLAHKIIITRFAMTLSVLVATGIPILESLEMVEKVIGNAVMAKAIKDARSKIVRGSKIADALKASEKFPADVVQMITAGEESGGLDIMLAKVANFYDVLVNNGIKKLTVLIEPVFLVFMGFLVGFIMFSMFMPLLKMVNVMQF